MVSELSGKGAGLVDTVRALLDESCPILVDAHCVGLLVEKVRPPSLPLVAVMHVVWPCTQAAKELNDPTLGASVAQEEELNARAKKTILLCKVSHRDLFCKVGYFCVCLWCHSPPSLPPFLRPSPPPLPPSPL